MPESLQLHQGPGLNGLYLSAFLPARKVDTNPDTVTYALLGGYTLSICGYPQSAPESSDFPLKPEACKLLDILVCELGDASRTQSRQVELPLEKFLQLAGHTVTEANKNAVRPRLKESAALLGALSADWTESGGRYLHYDVKFFDEIIYRNGCVYACFNEKMARYLLNCPSIPLPLPLLSVSGKSPHSYPLGRRCLVHNAANKGREWQAIRVRSLLAVCPRIPRPGSEEKWVPSILERKVIDPFTAAMNILEKCGIFVWKFREPVCRDDYEGFSNSMVEFQLQTEGSSPASPIPMECAGAKREYGPFNYKEFHAIR